MATATIPTPTTATPNHAAATRRAPLQAQSAGAYRGVVGVGLVGIALAHVLDLQSKMSEVPYLGWAYVGLIVSSLVLADLVVRRGGRTTFLASAGLAFAVILGYAVNRTVGMPLATDDIGNWLEPLGLASLVVEAAVAWFALAAARLRHA